MGGKNTVPCLAALQLTVRSMIRAVFESQILFAVTDYQRLSGLELQQKQQCCVASLFFQLSSYCRSNMLALQERAS